MCGSEKENIKINVELSRKDLKECLDYLQLSVGKFTKKPKDLGHPNSVLGTLSLFSFECDPRDVINRINRIKAEKVEQFKDLKDEYELLKELSAAMLKENDKLTTENEELKVKILKECRTDKVHLQKAQQEAKDLQEKIVEVSFERSFLNEQKEIILARSEQISTQLIALEQKYKKLSLSEQETKERLETNVQKLSEKNALKNEKIAALGVENMELKDQLKALNKTQEISESKAYKSYLTLLESLGKNK